MILACTIVLISLLLLTMWGLFLLGEKGREKARRWRMGLQEVRGFLLHPGLYYYSGHTWVMPQENGTVRIGLDDFGRRLVDGIRRVSLPPKGSLVLKGKSAIQLDCGKKRAKLLSPVDGVVTAVNEALTEEGEALERDPYGKGWLFTARVPNQSFTGLLTGTAAMEWLKGETDRLSLFLHRELGLMAADGGELIPKPPAMLSEEQWQTLIRAFFYTS
ncbi:MAG: hypothetical protein HY347_07645 [candidate division NC10 bacterium]|nr:hypothetical protein [candidate division NC10 bacterium]